MQKIIVDGNTAAAQIAYKFSQVIPIFPITPSTPMAEYCSGLNAKGGKNIFGESVKMIEMQSEAGVAGTLHGASLAGALTTTFTASQGLLLMLPNMYKIAAEALPTVFHVTARTIASHALSIFGDHSDVMATRMTGFCMLASSSVQECQDMALAAHILALKARTPVMHFFDGFRTSHEIQKITPIEDATLLKLFPKKEAEEFKNRALSPDHPTQYGTAQNPDVFFQNREASEPRYKALPATLEEVFNEIKNATGRSYKTFEYFGDQNAENIIVVIGSTFNVVKEYIMATKQKNVGVINVRLYRPFDQAGFVKALPKNVKNICTLDRTKECGALPPLALDVIACTHKLKNHVKVYSGRYGLGGKDFTPACAKAVIDNLLSLSPKDNFTVGIIDDLNNSSLPLEKLNSPCTAQEIKIYGLGSDGSVSASKSTIKILGKNSEKFVQGYFEYDSKKSGSMTISHLRISEQEILSSYLLQESDVISIGNFSFVHRYDCLAGLKQNGIVIINSIFDSQEIDKVIPESYVSTLKEKNARLFIINGHKIAKKNGLGEKINIIMQIALFKASNLIDIESAKKSMQEDIQKTFARKGQAVVDKNLSAMQDAENSLVEIDVIKLHGVKVTHERTGSGKFYDDIFNPIANLKGYDIPVSKFSETGMVPTGTSAFEKRNIASRLPQWLKENCIQCGQCVMSCPHSALRAVLVETKNVSEDKRDIFLNALGIKDALYKIQLSPEDCTGCGVCANTCPALKKALVMVDAETILDKAKENFIYANSLPKLKQTLFSDDHAKGCQFNQSYFEFPGACGGCGETPYIKLASMLFGENMLVANATGCSSIYAGSYPSCPFTKNENGKGPAWANSLFEDNAEFGLGLKLGSEVISKDKRSVWIIGGDGWAYDIGFGGLDHVLASDENVNILVLDNETYSNTGGQSSKGTPMGASVKLNEGGKPTHKKNLGQIAMTYRNAYVAQVALGANMSQCIKAFKEAENFEGPSLIIAYSTCINQGFNMENSLKEMKKAVECGYWPLYRYNPKDDKLYLDSAINESQYFDFLRGERRYASTFENAEKKELLESNKKHALEEYEILKRQSDKN